MSAIDSVAAVCNDYCQNQRPVWYYGAATAAGGVIGWLVNVYKVRIESKKLSEEASKLREERTKLETENAKLRTDAIKNKNEIENKHNEACVELGAEIDCLIDGIRNNDAKKCDYHREASCRIITDKVLFHFKQLAEMKIAIYKHPEDIFEGFIFRELSKYAEWLEVINNRNMLAAIEKVPLRISTHYFWEFSQLIRDNVADAHRDALIDKLQICINEMN